MNEFPRFSSIRSLAQAICAGEVSASAVIEDHLSAIRACNDTLAAFITVVSDAVQETTASPVARTRSLLHGIPYGVKDNIDTAGIRTTSASRLLMHNEPTRDADVVAQLRTAGAVLLGKLNTYEFGTGTGAVYPDLAFPIARNPWDLSRFGGGSSTGAGVAVAAGLTAFAIGTDTGGSVRLPAAACGVPGLKPTYGTLSRKGMQPNCYSMDHVGILARSVDDVRVVFSEILSPGSSGERPLPTGLHNVRVGFLSRFHEGDVACGSDIAAGLNTAAKTFRDLGATVIDLDLACGVLDFRACSRILNISECFSIHHEVLEKHGHEIGAALRDKLIAGSEVRAVDYINACRWRRVLSNAVDALFDQCDVVLCLGAPTVAPPLSDTAGVTAFTTQSAMAVFNISGHPAISLCNGYNQAGLPLNMQLAGRYGREAELLGIAEAYEAATKWFRIPEWVKEPRNGQDAPLGISTALSEPEARVAQIAANQAAVSRIPSDLSAQTEPAFEFRVPL